MTAIQKIKKQAEETELKFYEVRMSKYRSWIATMNMRERVDVVNGQLTITSSMGSVSGTEIDEDTDLNEFFTGFFLADSNRFATKEEAVARLVELHKETWYEKYRNSSKKYDQADLMTFAKMYDDWESGKNI